MASMTIRNIPDWALERIRKRAVAERRSLNNEIVVLLEQALEPVPDVAEEPHRMSPASQLQRWETLCGQWHDERRWEEIAEDIVSHRTGGREVAL